VKRVVQEVLLIVQVESEREMRARGRRGDVTRRDEGGNE